ncbi:MAG: low temperature requirement protein A [Algiphilus sp.]
MHGTCIASSANAAARFLLLGPVLDSLRFPPRDPTEPHRGVTPLELLFDLAAVVAIGAAAQGLADFIVDGRPMAGLAAFVPSFFMVWWSWMNFTWFASAYDDRSNAFRGLSMTVMFGALMLAAGVGAVFEGQPIWMALLGFIVMRLGMALLWLGAWRGDPQRRPTALRYALGISAMQWYWIGLVALVSPAAPLYLPLFALGAAGELAVPAMAERRAATPWHRQHIIARYGRLNLIVLGQAFLAVVTAFELEPGSIFPQADGIGRALVFAVIAFSMWSVYFTKEPHLVDGALRHSLLWGYGHVVVFATGAAVGAGMLAVLQAQGEGMNGAQWSVAAPVALYCATLWWIRDRFALAGPRRWSLLLAAGLVMMLGAIPGMGLALTACILAATALVRRAPAQPGAKGPA